jgi:hypothetical protein
MPWETLAAPAGNQIGTIRDARGRRQDGGQNGLLTRQVDSPEGGGLTTMPALLLPVVVLTPLPQGGEGSEGPLLGWFVQV